MGKPNDFQGDLMVRIYGPLYTLLALFVLSNLGGVNLFSRTGSPWTNVFVAFVVLGFAFMDAAEVTTVGDVILKLPIPEVFLSPFNVALAIVAGVVKGVFHGLAAIVAAGLLGAGFPALLPVAPTILLVFAANWILIIYSGWLIYQRWPESARRYEDWLQATLAYYRSPNRFVKTKYGIYASCWEFCVLAGSLIGAGWLTGIPVFAWDAAHAILWVIVIFGSQFLQLGGLWLRSKTVASLLKTVVAQVAVAAFYVLISLSLATNGGEAVVDTKTLVWSVFTVLGIGLISYIEAHYLRLYYQEEARTEAAV